MSAALCAAGLTMTQAFRLSICARTQERLRRPFCFDDLSDALDVEGALAARFLREMARRGFLLSVGMPPMVRGRRCRWFLMGERWLLLVRVLAADGVQPGVCSVCRAREPLPFMFRGRFLCRECLCADEDQTTILQTRGQARTTDVCNRKP